MQCSRVTTTSAVRAATLAQLERRQRIPRMQATGTVHFFCSFCLASWCHRVQRRWDVQLNENFLPEPSNGNSRQ
jgi:hypothetical protein